MQVRTYVITINYKVSTDTTACIASLKQSTVPIATVVVDNTPNDPVLEAALAPYSDVKLIYAAENLGFGRGNNLGIRWALENSGCEYVLILNNDAAIKPDTVLQLEEAMERHPEAGIVAARIVLAEDESRLWYGGGEVDWRRGGARVPGMLGPADAPLAMKGRHVTFASGCAMMIRRELLNTLGGFDSRYFMYGEDLELSLRIQEFGWKIWYEPSALVSHVGQGSQGKRSRFISRYDPENPNLAFLVYHGVKGSLFNVDMHAHFWDKLLFFSFFPIFLGLKSIQWAKHGRLDGIKSLWNAMRDYRRER